MTVADLMFLLREAAEKTLEAGGEDDSPIYVKTTVAEVLAMTDAYRVR